MDRYIQNSDVAWRAYDDEALLVDPVESCVRQLNETAAHLWAFLDQARSVSDCAEELVRVFEVDRKTAKRDASEIIAEFLGKNLIVNADIGSG